MINSRAMPVPLTRSYQRVAGTVPQHAPATTLPTPWGPGCPRHSPGTCAWARRAWRTTSARCISRPGIASALTTNVHRVG